MNKLVFLFWSQGWSQAPWLVQRVRQSYESCARGWQIQLLDANNVTDIVKLPPTWNASHVATAARSDIIRLHLLAQHGGLWADASLLCMRPLDEWLPAALEPAGFWSFHSGSTQMPCSWVLAAHSDSYMARAWSNASDAFWQQTNTTKYDYMWMDGLFAKLLSTDATFKAQWGKAPVTSCSGLAGAAGLHGLHGEIVTSEHAAALVSNTPGFVKLSHHGGPQTLTPEQEASMPNTTTRFVLDLSRRLLAGSTVPKQNMHVVLSYYNEPLTCVQNTMEFIKKTVENNWEIQLFIYTKGGEFANATRLPNIGREGGSYLHHILTHWHALPHHVLFAQACAHDEMKQQLPLLKPTTQALNLGGFEHGDCDGTPAYPMRRLREIYAFVHRRFCPDGVIFKSWMKGQFLVSKHSILKNSKHVYELLNKTLFEPPEHFIHTDLKLIKDENNRKRIEATELNDNANYFSYQLERAWSSIFE